MMYKCLSVKYRESVLRQGGPAGAALLRGGWGPYVLAGGLVACPIRFVVSLSLAERRHVRSSGIVRIVELDAIVLPKTHGADVVGAAGRLSKGAMSAAWAGKVVVHISGLFGCLSTWK